jgi:hypothetical protein
MKDKEIDSGQFGQSDLVNERGCLIPLPSSFEEKYVLADFSDRPNS